jgi:primosomal protein N''
MAKKKHVIRGCKSRLRPRLASIRRKVEEESQRKFDYLNEKLALRNEQLVESKNQLATNIRDRDVGRSLKSHLSGWWTARGTHSSSNSGTSF